MDKQHSLIHYGVIGMKWGVTTMPSGATIRTKVVEGGYSIGAKLQPREGVYGVKRTLTKTTFSQKQESRNIIESVKQTGVLTTDSKVLAKLDKVGVDKHKSMVYDNINAEDIQRLKKYTDAAIYSRAVNGYLATGTPKEIADKASQLKQTIGKNKIDNQVVFRSCNLKFSTNGLANKLSLSDEKALAQQFNAMSNNFKNKSVGENRIYSTSTSPSFAIDTWRKVNPTAAKTYNSYMVIDCKKTPGIYADGRTSEGKTLVNSRSNQECILAPNKMVYKKMTYDEDRKMFAIYMEAQ